MIPISFSTGKVASLFPGLFNGLKPRQKKAAMSTGYLAEANAGCEALL